MKTLLLLLAFTIIFNSNFFAQRNTGTVRNPPGDRIDRIDQPKVENPVRNPEQKREPIKPPYREELNPIRPSRPEMPGRYEPVCNPYNPVPIETEPISPIYDPPLPLIIDNEPRLEDLTLSEVYILGIKNLDLELYNKAIKCFNFLLDDDPLNYELYCFRGRAYHGLELYDRAIKDFQKSIKINKRFADSYYYLGLTEISIDDIDAAIVDFQIAADMGNEKAKQIMKKYFSRQ